MNPEIVILHGDITLIPADAIVNAANSSLLGGGGVDGAIHKAAGPALLDACKLLMGCESGKAKITPAFNLPARFVIHAVGPVWRGGSQRETELLASCYTNSMQLALEHQCRSISFPNISTGVYGFPKQNAANIAWNTVLGFLKQHKVDIQVNFVIYDHENLQLYNQLKKKTTEGHS